MSAGKAIRIGLAVVVGAVLVIMVFSTRAGQGEPDFLAYWSAARLFVAGENPYDPAALRALGHETRPQRGQDHGEPFASWNPPWLLVVLAPLGLLPFDLASRAWMLCNMGLLIGASALTWQTLTGGSEPRGALVAMTLGVWSGSALVTILTGQTSSLVLVALVLHAWFLQAGRDGLAGATLLLAAIKPHTTAFVLLLAICRAICHRRWRVISGLLVASAVSMGILWVVFPPWLSAYLHLMNDYRNLFFLYSTPTIGSLAFALWQTNWFRYAGVLLLPFVPAGLRLADTQGWPTAMNVALLASLPLAAYGFNADQVLLLPALLQVVVWLWRKELARGRAKVTAAGLLVVYIASFSMLFIPARMVHWCVLLPLALAGLYGLAWSGRQFAPPGHVARMQKGSLA